jgi:hypothetical protein
MNHRGMSKESFRARALRYLMLRGYAPVPQDGHSGRVFRPCFLCRGSNSLLSPPVKLTSGQGINVRGVRGIRTPLFSELPDVSAYSATDHKFQHPGKEASAMIPINSRCNRQTSPPDASNLIVRGMCAVFPAAQWPGRLGEYERCAWSPEAILRA